MTHVDNLKSLSNSGIFSRSAVRNFKNVANLDVVSRRSGIHEDVHGKPLLDYACLYFNPKNPMLYAKKEIQDSMAIIEVKKDVLKFGTTVYTDGNAASSDTRFFAGGYNNFDCLGELNWDCIYASSWNDHEDGRRLRCAEVLVLKCIGTHLIAGVHVRTSAVKNSVDHLTEFPVNVTPSKFFQ